MKKLIKFCAVTGLVLLLLGIGTTSVSAGLGGRFRDTIPYRMVTRLWDHHIRWGGDWDDWRDYTGQGHMDMRYDDDDWHESGRRHSYESADAGFDNSPGIPDTGSPAEPGAKDIKVFDMVRRLDLDIDKGSVRIYESQDITQITVHVTDEYNKTTCYMDEETLKIKRRNQNRMNDNPQIEVLVPAGSHFDKLSLDMGVAECEISGISTSKLDIDNGVGDVSFRGSITGSADLETGVGTIILNLVNSETDYNYKVECGMGSIRIGDTEYSMISDDKRINNQAPYTMDLECGVGDITINFNQTV